MNQVSLSDLTRRKSHIFEMIVSYVWKYGFVPTVREMCILTGLASTSSIARHLGGMENIGYIRRCPKYPMAITILE